GTRRRSLPPARWIAGGGLPERNAETGFSTQRRLHLRAPKAGVDRAGDRYLRHSRRTRDALAGPTGEVRRQQRDFDRNRCRPVLGIYVQTLRGRWLRSMHPLRSTLV